MRRLITYDTFPPGQFWYKDPNREKIFGGSHGAREQAKRVSDFRRGNGFPRASVVDALEDIDAFTCERLRYDPRWVQDTDIPFVQGTGLATSTPCATCGAELP